MQWWTRTTLNLSHAMTHLEIIFVGHPGVKNLVVRSDRSRGSSCPEELRGVGILAHLKCIWGTAMCHCTSVGKLCLSWCPVPHHQRSIVSGPLEKQLLIRFVFLIKKTGNHNVKGIWKRLKPKLTDITDYEGLCEVLWQTLMLNFMVPAPPKN